MRRKFLIFVIVFLLGFAHSEAKAATLETQKKSLVIHLGQSTQVVLHSTAWQLDSIQGNSVKANGSSINPILPGPNAPEACQIPGLACGTSTWKFKAVRRGFTQLIFKRDTCGEALKCNASDSIYKVQIKVA